MQKLCCFLLGVTRTGLEAKRLLWLRTDFVGKTSNSNINDILSSISNALWIFNSSLFKTTKWDCFVFSSLPFGAQWSKKDVTSLILLGTRVFCLIYKLDQPERTEFPFSCNLHFSFDFWMLWSVIERADGFIKNPKKARENHMSLIAKEKNSIA